MDKDMQPVMTIDEDGDTVWRLPSRKIHRTDGPAVEYADGGKQWRLHGKYMSFDEWLIANTEISEEDKVMMKLQYG
jgi:hypothetical protein